MKIRTKIRQIGENRTGLERWNDLQAVDFVGGAEGNRTLDLLNAIQALSQLSYGPTLRRGRMTGKIKLESLFEVNI